MYLVKNPDKLAKLREELDLATASNPHGVLPTYDQVRNLPYLTGCINESLRLRPVAATGTFDNVLFCVPSNGELGVWMTDRSRSFSSWYDQVFHERSPRMSP